MADESLAARAWDRVAFAGDCVVSIAFAAMALSGGMMQLIGAIGPKDPGQLQSPLAGVGAIVGAVLAVPAGLALAWLLHSRRFTRRFALGLVGGVVGSLALGAAGYAVVIAFSSSALERYVLLALIAVEAVFIAWLVIGSISDLVRRREHRALDVMRIVFFGLVVLVLGLFASNPDFGVALLVIGPSVFVSATAGVICDWIASPVTSSEQVVGGHAPPAVTA